MPALNESRRVGKLRQTIKALASETLLRTPIQKLLELWLLWTGITSLRQFRSIIPP